MEKNALILAMFLCSLLVANAASGKITGKIIDANENTPLTSANVALYKSKDSLIVTGSITDKSGNFSIAADVGEYYLEVKYIGYKTKYVLVAVTADKSNVQLGSIKLEQTEIMQKNIIVEAEKEPVILGIDSKIFNVTKDITAGGSTILDVLRKIPSVNVDLEDNITMNGSSPKILIDGRESNLSSTEMLKVLSSDLVESVELITNPSAKYESEGVSGIIDIHLKKEIDDGFNGMINAWAGADVEMKYSKNASMGFNGNYKMGKINWFGNFYYGHWNNNSNNRSNRTTWISNDGWMNFDTTYTNISNENKMGRGWYGGKIGADIEWTKTDLMSISTNVNGNNGDRTGLTTHSLLNNDHKLNRLYYYDDKGDGSGNNINFALNYKKTFAEKGHNLYVDAYVSRDVDNRNGNRNQFDEINNESDSAYKAQLKFNINDTTYREVVQVDYEKTLELLGNLGAGAKMVYRQIDYNDNRFKFINGEYRPSPPGPGGTSDSYDYSDGILSAYFTLGKKWESFSYRLGLRAEYTNWDLHSNILDSSYNNNYLSIIPTAHLKYNWGITHSVSGSYSRRLQRPWYSQLNPFESVVDSNSVSHGNPYLVESYYNSYAFNYMLFTPKATITASLSYRNTDNASQQYFTLSEWGGIRSYPMNIALNSNYGASISLTQTITDWWNLNGYFSINKQTYEAALPDYGFAKREQTNWSVNLNTTFRLIEKMRLQLSGYYSPASISLQGKNAAYYSVNAGLNYEFWDDRMNANLNCNNLIFPDNSEYFYFGDNFTSYSHNNWQHRQISFGISYKINDYKQKQERNAEEGGIGASQGGNSGSGGNP